MQSIHVASFEMNLHSILRHTQTRGHVMPKKKNEQSKNPDKPIEPAKRSKPAKPTKPAKTHKPSQLVDEVAEYKVALRALQIEMVKLQRHAIHHGSKVLIILEGRDAAGKDGSIKRMIQFLSPRETRVVALGKPSDRESSGWYFQRFARHLPVSGELVFFNRSWYNRAGVERVLHFCTKQECEVFLQSVSKFEEMLVASGMMLLKYYLDISHDEQKRRLTARAKDPLKQWKTSPVDSVAIKHWKDYSTARDEMLIRTHTPIAPWHVIHSDDKHAARLNLMRDILSQLDYAAKKHKLVVPDPLTAFAFTPELIHTKRLAR
jgi:polyphosphate kinase